MIGEVIDQKEITLAEVAKSLESVGGELEYEQRKALEYASSVYKLGVDDAQKLVQELMGLGLSESVARNLTDILPKNADSINSILQFDRKTIKEDLVNNIVELLNKYRG